MSLRNDMRTTDLDNVFFHVDSDGNPDEHASWQKFRISDGKGKYRNILAVVVVDPEWTQERPTLKQYDIVEGDADVLIKQSYFPRRPQAGEVIYWNEDILDQEPNFPWEILKCVVEDGAYRLTLYSVRDGMFTHSQS